ncbi:MAG: hypothetical protein R6U98_12855, partial [Pirellulaceae bacterium]
GQRLHLALIGWNDEQEAITAWGFWAPGVGPHEQVVYEKTDTGWLVTREGLRGEITIEGKDKYTYEAEWESKSGKKNHWGFTARRIKPPTRQEVKEWLEYLEGTWKRQWSGPIKLADSEYHRRPIEDGMALLTEFSEAKETQTEIVGWQPDSRILLATGYGSDGRAYEVRFNEFGDDYLRGPFTGRLPDDTEYEGVITLKRIDADHHRFTMHILMEGKTVELTTEDVRKVE